MEPQAAVVVPSIRRESRWSVRDRSGALIECAERGPAPCTETHTVLERTSPVSGRFGARFGVQWGFTRWAIVSGGVSLRATEE
jgi:hypothetical protein